MGSGIALTGELHNNDSDLQSIPVTDNNNSTARTSFYIPALTGLRGFSVLCVLIFHANVHWLPGGFLGVDVFFVLSGFLISSLLMREFSRTGDIALQTFYLRRALRLLPALLLLLLTFWVAMGLRDGLSGLSVASKELITVLLYASNWSRAFEWNAPLYLGHTWSLSIEEQFYLIWPLCLLYLLRFPRLNPLWVTLAVAFGSALWRAYLAQDGASVDRLYNGLDTRLDGLMLGACLGLAYARGHIGQWQARVSPQFWQFTSLLALTLIACCLVGVRLWLDMRLYYGLLHLFQWCALLLIISLLGLSSGLGHWLFTNPLMTWLGTISYGVYLWHFPIYRFMQDVGFSHGAVLFWGVSLTLVLADLSWRYLEQPLMRRAPSAQAPGFQISGDAKAD